MYKNLNSMNLTFLQLGKDLVKCIDCGKEIPEDDATYCDYCGALSAKNAEP